MRILIILVIVVAILVSLLASDQYYLSLQDKELKKSDWVQNCIPVGSDGIVPAIGLFNHTHSFDLQTCSWTPTEHGTPGFLESLYISFIEPIFLDIADNLEIKYTYAACTAPLFGPPGPCFDSFMISHDRITEEYIMNHIYEYINVNYDRWQMSDREWSNEDITLDLPTIICTEFVADDHTEYRILKWVDSHTISSLENHRNDSLCNKWLAPISDDLPICEQNPKHDFGKCQRNFETPIFTLEQILDVCNATSFVSGEQKAWWNATHFIDTFDCEFYDKVDGSPTYGQVINTKKSPVTGSDDLTDEQVCGIGFVVINGICIPSDIFEADDPSFSKQNLQTGETISNPEIMIIIESLGAGLIVLFIIIYAIRKRRKK